MTNSLLELTKPDALRGSWMLDRLSSLVRKRARNSDPGLIPRLATYADYKEYEAWQRRTPQPATTTSLGAESLAEVVQNGICIIPEFWSDDTCTRARAEIDRVITEYPKHVNGNAKADVRVYGANNASALIDTFAQDPQLLSIASAYNRKPTITAFTLAARMPTSPGNNGSGEGWHRDAFLRQFKAIMYLSDVAPENGPFQLMQDSQRRAQLLNDMKTGNLKYMQYRIEEETIDRILAGQPDRLKTYTGRAGTLILVDTSAVHRGKPIQAGTRYALTNYYFPTDAIDQSMYEKFDVLPRT